jgi:hypothetical protein
MAVPLLLYGCENRALKRTNDRKSESAEMKFLRVEIKFLMRVAGYTL